VFNFSGSEPAGAWCFEAVYNGRVYETFFNVNIALYHNGVYGATLANNTPGDGEYLWVLGSAISPGPGYTCA
jgi:hypothetical protein